jgi:hypothetical protein
MDCYSVRRRRVGRIGPWEVGYLYIYISTVPSCPIHWNTIPLGRGGGGGANIGAGGLSANPPQALALLSLPSFIAPPCSFVFCRYGLVVCGLGLIISCELLDPGGPTLKESGISCPSPVSCFATVSKPSPLHTLELSASEWDDRNSSRTSCIRKD